VESLPRDLGDVVRRVRDGTFSVHLEHCHIDRVIHRLVLGVMTAAMFVGSSLLWSMKVSSTLEGISVFGAAGYLIAAYFGWRLLHVIKKSGDVS
jgi:ubiquinone biosynthesis protein